VLAVVVTLLVAIARLAGRSAVVLVAIVARVLRAALVRVAALVAAAVGLRALVAFAECYSVVKSE
jgi:hypothetical protein